MHPDDFADLLGRIYGAAERPAEWSSFLELVGDAEVRGGEYYNDFGRQYGCVNAAFGLLEPTGSRIGFVTVNRGDGQPAFAPLEVRLLQALNPHLRQAFRLQRRLTDAAGATAVACGALDALPSGVVLLDADGIVRFMNRVATELVARKDGLWTDGRRLRGTRKADTEHLAGAVRVASPLFRQVATASAPLAFTLSRASGKSPLRVVVVPAGGHVQALGADVGASVAVFVTDPERNPIDAPARLAQLFGFTPTEARVAALLAGGSTVSEIADALAIRPDTVRGHVKQLLSKAGVRTQGQLIGLILRGPAGILLTRQATPTARARSAGAILRQMAAQHTTRSDSLSRPRAGRSTVVRSRPDGSRVNPGEDATNANAGPRQLAEQHLRGGGAVR